jgi:hypothetical protein
MPQSLAAIYVHRIYSTKNRESQSRPEIEEDLRKKKHHRRITFQDEFRAFLTKYELEYNERYVWD